MRHRLVKIAIVATFVPSERAGGVERVAWAQARALVERGHAVRLVAGTDAPFAGEDLCREHVGGIDLVRVPRGGDEAFGLELVRERVIECVRRAVGEADLVHLHHWYTLSEGLVAALARVAPVVLSLHDHFASCPRFFRSAPPAGPACPSGEDHATCARCVALDLPGRTHAQLEERLRARARRFADELAAASVILAPSRRHRGDLERTLPLAGLDVRVLAPGLCTELASERALPPVWDGASELRVLHFGRRSPEKGTLDLVRALGSLSEGRARLIAPGGSVSPAFDVELQLDAGPLALELSGTYSPEHLPAFASRAHLAAFPSRLVETYSLVVDEALSLGLPVWTTAAAASERFPAPCVRRLPAGDPAAWADAFRRLLDDPGELARARSALPARVPSAHDVAAELEQIYEGILSARDVATSR